MTFMLLDVAERTQSPNCNGDFAAGVKKTAVNESMAASSKRPASILNSIMRSGVAGGYPKHEKFHLE